MFAMSCIVDENDMCIEILDETVYMLKHDDMMCGMIHNHDPFQYVTASLTLCGEFAAIHAE